MTKHGRALQPSLLAALSLSLTAGRADAAASFSYLPSLPSGPNVVAQFVTDFRADSLIFVGRRVTLENNQEVTHLFRWKPGMAEVELLPDPAAPTEFAEPAPMASSDGTIVAALVKSPRANPPAPGLEYRYDAARWTTVQNVPPAPPTTTITVLSTPLQSPFARPVGSIVDMSGDGSTILGQYLCDQCVLPPFIGWGIWRNGAAFAPFQGPEFGPEGLDFDPLRSRYAFSNDGSKLIGTLANYGGAFLTPSGLVQIPRPAANEPFFPESISGDGQVIFGRGAQGDRSLRRGADGTYEVLAIPTGFAFISGFSLVSADGAVAVGTGFTTDGFSRPVLWTPATGVVDLFGYAISVGATNLPFSATGAATASIIDISADGKRLLGAAFDGYLFTITFCEPICNDVSYAAATDHFFNDPAAWNAGVPNDHNDAVLFNNTGTYTVSFNQPEVSGSATIARGTIDFSMLADGQWLLSPAACPCLPYSLMLADLPGAQARVNLLGASAVLGCEQDVIMGGGSGSQATMTLSPLSQLVVTGNGTDAVIRIGKGDNSSSELVVSALATVVANGAELGGGVTASGIATVAAGGSMECTGKMTLGNKGSGILNLDAGGHVEVADLTSAIEPGSAGLVLASGAAAQLSISSPTTPVIIGAKGESVLSFENGADLVLSGLSLSRPIVLGSDSTGNGTMTFVGSGTKSIVSDGQPRVLVSNAAGSQGLIGLSAGADVTLGSVVIGATPGSHGDLVAVDGVFRANDSANPSIFGQGGSGIGNFVDSNLSMQSVRIGIDGGTGNISLDGDTVFFATDMTVSDGSSSGQVAVNAGATLELSGNIAVGIGGSVNVTGDVFFGATPPFARGDSQRAAGGLTAAGLELNGGTLSPTGTITFGQGAIIGGTGPFTSLITNNGTVRPGGSNHTGTLDAQAGYIQHPGGTLEIEADAAPVNFGRGKGGGGPQPGAIDELRVSGAVQIDGTLLLKFIGPTAPGAGTGGVILTADSITGDFASIQTQGLDPSLRVILDRTTTAITATVTCKGDINADFAINTLDLILLLQRFGQSVPRGSNTDINPDGAVNTLDLIQLLQGFGNDCQPAGGGG